MMMEGMVVDMEAELPGDGAEAMETVDFESASPFDRLSTETLSHVLSFCDFSSAVRFSRETNKSLRQELYRGDHFLWKEIFHRHCFSMPQLTGTSTNDNGQQPTPPSVDYLLETRQRRQLARTLVLPKNKKKGVSPSRSCCFNLPNRMFYFVAITPDGLFAEWDDPPPVDFDCDSFILTSPACGGEMVSLDPFHGTLVVHESCLDNAVASDEGMMEHAMLEAANLIDGHRENNRGMSLGEHYLPEEHIAGAVFDRNVYRNHNITQYKKQPSQVLFCLENDIDVDACFPHISSSHNGDTTRTDFEIEVGYHGIDAKCMLKDGQVVGSMIAVGRMVTREIGLQFNGVQEQVCTELHTWERRNKIVPTEKESAPHKPSAFGSRKICRFPWSFRTIDVCASYNRVYVSFDASDGPLSSSMGNNDHDSRSTVVVFPLDAHPDKKDTNRNLVTSNEVCKTKYHDPECFIHCKSEISSLAIDPTGDTLVVGTEAGTCEVWNIQSDTSGVTKGKRMATVNIKSSMSKALQNTREDDDDEQSADTMRIGRTLLTILNRPKIVSFHHPSHLPFSTCGFVTLQHSATDGSSLLLWRKNTDPSSSDAYRIVSMINLPLSGTTRPPRVFFDGRRILVFGQDHIGLIILVYQVLASFEDISLFQDTTKEEASGGVYNLTKPSRVRFANRIRHAALGGLQYYDSIHMTCNDRFIVVNTKTGNLLSDSTSPYAEGLLVIDLQD